MQGRLVISRVLGSNFKMKKKEDKERDKALGNEQGLRCHKLEARQTSVLGLSVGFEIRRCTHCGP